MTFLPNKRDLVIQVTIESFSKILPNECSLRKLINCLLDFLSLIGCCVSHNLKRYYYKSRHILIPQMFRDIIIRFDMTLIFFIISGIICYGCTIDAIYLLMINVYINILKLRFARCIVVIFVIVYNDITLSSIIIDICFKYI